MNDVFETRLTNMVDMLTMRASVLSHRLAYTFVPEDGRPETSRSYGQLLLRAKAIAMALRRGNLTGAPALLLYPPGLPSVEALLGCLFAGVLAVPMPDLDSLDSGRLAEHLAAVATDSGATTVLTCSETLGQIQRLLANGRHPRSVIVVTDEIPDDLAPWWQQWTPQPSAPAVLFYGDRPAGPATNLVFTHGCLMESLRRFRALSTASREPSVSWLPGYQPFGLVSGVLRPLFTGGLGVLLSAAAVQRNPASWLRAISRHQAVFSLAPPTAYEMCTRRAGEEELAGLDLSSWRVAAVGPQPGPGQLTHRFAERFAPYGFDPKAILNCYGPAMVGAPLAVTGASERSTTVQLCSSALERGQAVVGAADSRRQLSRRSVGPPGDEVLVVDPRTGRPQQPGEVGEIHLTGPTAPSGTWRGQLPLAPVTVRCEGDDRLFWPTGDAGVLLDRAGEELVVLGSLRERISLHGRTVYAQDLRSTTERSHRAIRPGRVAAFTEPAPAPDGPAGADGEEPGDSGLTVVAEVHPYLCGNTSEVARAVRTAIRTEHDLPLLRLVLLLPDQLPSRLDGEVDHDRCRRALAAGALRALPTAETTDPEPATDPGDPAAQPERESTRPGAFALTRGQESLLTGAVGRENGGPTTTRRYLEFEAQGLDLDRLATAWRRTVEHHEMLRVAIESRSRQVIRPPEWYEVAVTDLDADAAEEGLRTVRDEMLEPVSGPWQRWPLFEVRLTRLPAERARVHLAFDALIADENSIPVMLRTWQRYYDNPEAALAAPAFRFCRFVDLTTGGWDAARSRTAESGPPELPIAHPAMRAVDLTAGRLETVSSRLTPDTWHAVRRQARQFRLTFAAILGTAFGNVLREWSTAPEFTVGVTTFQRPALHPEIDATVGPFSSVVPVVMRARKGGFARNALEVQRQFRQCPGESADKDLSLPPPVVFTPVAGDFAAASGWLGQLVHTERLDPRRWLGHQVVQDAGGIRLHWEARAELLPNGLLREISLAEIRLLERLGTDSGLWLRSTPGRFPRPRQAPPGRSEEPAAEVLHHGILRQFGSQPNATAVVCADRRVSFAGLVAAATMLADQLRERGVGPGDVVAVQVSQGWEQVIAVVGVLQSGAGCLPLATDSGQDTVLAALRDCAVSTVVTSAETRAAHPWPSGVEPVVLGSGEARGPCPPADSGPARPNDLAYLVPAGTPQAPGPLVAMEHRAALATLSEVTARFRIGPADLLLSTAPFGSARFMCDVLGALRVGAGVLLTGSEADGRPPAPADRPTPTVWSTSGDRTDLLPSGPEAAEDTPRLILLGDAAVPTSAARDLRARYPQVPLVALGGHPETSSWSFALAPAEDDLEQQVLPYGPALTGQWALVLDEEGDPCPAGVTGMVHIGGCGLARGYWNGPQPGPGAFVQYPRTGERLFRTGQWGRLLADGRLLWADRTGPAAVEATTAEGGDGPTPPGASGQVGVAVSAPPVSPAGTDGPPAARSTVATARLPTVQRRRSDSGETTGLDVSRLRMANPGGPQALGQPFPLSSGDLTRTVSAARRGGNQILLANDRLEETSLSRYRTRRSVRRFDQAPVPRGLWTSWLAVARERPCDGRQRRLYPSARGAYLVDLYVHAKPGGVEGVTPGSYAYDPVRHGLIALDLGCELDRGIHAVGNQETFDQAQFSLFLVADLSAAEPRYGAIASDFCLLEAGALLQLLMMGAAELGLGVCPIGAMDTTAVRRSLDLPDRHLLMHTLLGGLPPRTGRSSGTTDE